MDGFATKVRYSLAFMGGSPLGNDGLQLGVQIQL
jgi:hypothetical protein